MNGPSFTGKSLSEALIIGSNTPTGVKENIPPPALYFFN
jgi:hypothetical protein